jgi:hypothetical protein
MSTTFSRLQIINAALLAQGQTELAAESDGSLEWRTLAAQWPFIVEGELEDGGYAHQFVEQHVPSCCDKGRFGFENRYWLPSQALHVRRVFTEAEEGQRTYLDEWYQDSNGLNVNATDGIWVEFVEAVDPEEFSPNFARGIQKKLEVHIARAMKEEHQLGDRLEQEAQMYLQRARTSSANKSGPKRLFREDSIFSKARFRRG